VKCPLCSSSIERVNFKKNGQFLESLILHNLKTLKNPASDQDNYARFDHAYFLKEYEKLNGRSKDLEFTIKSDRKHIYYDSGSWNALENLKVDIGRKMKMMKEFKKFEAKYLLDDILANDLTLKRIKNREFETYEAEINDKENNHEYDDYNYYEGYDKEENYQEEVEIDLHLASYIKKNHISLAKLDKKNVSVPNTSPKKKKKGKKEIKVGSC